MPAFTGLKRWFLAMFLFGFCAGSVGVMDSVGFNETSAEIRNGSFPWAWLVIVGVISVVMSMVAAIPLTVYLRLWARPIIAGPIGLSACMAASFAMGWFFTEGIAGAGFGVPGAL